MTETTRKQKYTTLKKLVGLAKNTDELKNFLETKYTRITDTNTDKFNNIYKVFDIFNSKTIKTLVMHPNEIEEIILEISKDTTTNTDLIIIYNYFQKEQQKEIQIYTTRKFEEKEL